MAKNLLEIEDIPPQLTNKVKQNLKFKTGKFIWRVRFTAPLNPSTVNNVNMYVTSEVDGKPLQTSIRYNSAENTVDIEPLEAYAKNTSYVLHVTKNVRSKGGQALKDEIRIRFSI